MSGAGLDSSTSSELVVTSTRSVMPAISRILLELILLGGDATAMRIPASLHAPQQVRDRGEGTHQRQVFGLEALAAPFLHLLAVIPLRVGVRGNAESSLSPPLPIWLLACSKLTS